MKSLSGSWRSGLFASGAFFLIFTGAVVAQQDDDATPYHQALLNYKAGHYDAAHLAIDDAEKANPDDVATAILKGRILTEQGEFADGATLLRRFLGPNGPLEVQLALGDLFLRQRDFGAAGNMYDQALNLKPNDPDITLKLIYAKINTSDLISAGKYASELKPLDPLNPAYYFAKAALAETTGKSNEADEDIQTVRTIYGITVANHYLRTYLQVFAQPHKNNGGAPPPASAATPPTNSASAQP